jgi:hypothetical protein
MFGLSVKTYVKRVTVHQIIMARDDLMMCGARLVGNDNVILRADLCQILKIRLVT